MMPYSISSLFWYSLFGAVVLFSDLRIWNHSINGTQSEAGSTNKHLDLGDKMVAAGRLLDALAHYHQAVELEPGNYRVYNQRAKVYLKLHRIKPAIRDLDQVINLKPQLKSARLERAKLKMKLGDVDAAADDFKKLLEQDPENEEAKIGLKRMEPMEGQIAQAKDAFSSGGYQAAIRILNQVIQASPLHVEMRVLRSSCHEVRGDLKKAVDDLQAVSKLRTDTEGFLHLSKLLYALGNTSQSLVESRQCLRLDPDHKSCYDHFVKVKRLAKIMESLSNQRDEARWRECLETANKMAQIESLEAVYRQLSREHRCYCHARAGDYDLAMPLCHYILDSDEKNIDALSGRAELHMIEGEYHTGLGVYLRVEELAGSQSWVQDGIQRAEQLLMQSQSTDHYKVLDVRRHAKKKQIMKAYKKLVARWHPDKCRSSSISAHTIYKVFYDICEAREVLGDPERRRLYDQQQEQQDPFY